jgi:hypothetical protein
MLNAIMLSAIMLSTIMLNAIILSAIMLSAIMLNAIMLRAIMLSAIMLSAILQSAESITERHNFIGLVHFKNFFSGARSEYGSCIGNLQSAKWNLYHFCICTLVEIVRLG